MLAPVLRDYLAERSGFEVKIALDGEATGAADFFHFGEGKIAPLLFVATDVAEESEVFILFAFRGKPGPSRPRTEKLGVLCRARSYVVLIGSA